MKRPPAILFDHDGVLVASEPLHWAAWEGLSAEIGIPHDTDFIQAQVGKTAPEILNLLLQKHRPNESFEPEQLKQWVDRKNVIYLERAQGGLQPYPGVLDGLRWMRENGVRAAVVSNARRRELVAVLENLGIAPFMEVIISRNDVPAFKPNPTPYLFAAATLGLKIEECFAIEDSPPGLEAALLAKTYACAVTTNFPREHLQQPVPGRPDLKPKWIGANMTEFFAMLKTLTSSS